MRPSRRRYGEIRLRPVGRDHRNRAGVQRRLAFIQPPQGGFHFRAALGKGFVGDGSVGFRALLQQQLVEFECRRFTHGLGHRGVARLHVPATRRRRDRPES